MNLPYMCGRKERQKQSAYMGRNSLHPCTILTFLAFLSGGCSLAYEVLYMRLLTTAFGDIFYVNAALLSTFLAGIAIGSRYARTLKGWLPLFEITTGLYALLFPAFIQWLVQQEVMVLITSHPPLTVLATMVSITLPGLFIGFSIPLFSLYMKQYGAGKPAFSHVYAVYNIGAVLSVITVEFFLVRMFGIKLSLSFTGGINILIGSLLLYTGLARPAVILPAPRPFPSRVVTALALASFASAVFQLVVLKTSHHFFYPARENFSLTLAVILAGIALGTYGAARFRTSFETCLLWAAFSIAVIYSNFHPLLRLYHFVAPIVEYSPPWNSACTCAFLCIFGLFPMAALGAMVPALMRREGEVAGEAGFLLFVSGLANAAGYLAYVFAGHPLLPGGALIAVLLGLLLTAASITTGLKFSRSQRVLALLTLAAIAIIPFIWQERYFYLARWFKRVSRDDRITIFKSNSDSATLIRTRRGLEWISYNGHLSINVLMEGKVNSAEMVSGIIPALCSPGFDRALVFGLGAGITSGTMASIYRKTDVVDLNRAFYRMLPELAYANLDMAGNRSVSIHITDGRAFLAGKSGIYDAILNTAESPDYFAAQKLYTVEFYRAVAKALKPGGVFCTWVSTPEMSEDGVMLVLSALRKSFRYCDIYLMRNSYCQITCSNSPLKPRLFSTIPARGELKKRLTEAMPGFNLDEYFNDILIGMDIFTHFTPQVSRENTDDFPSLEFLSLRELRHGRRDRDIISQNALLFNIDVVKEDDPRDPARMARRARAIEEAGIHYFYDYYIPILSQNRQLFEYFLQGKAESLLLMERSPAEALRILEQAEGLNSRSAVTSNLMGRAKMARGDYDGAVQCFKKALRLQPAAQDTHAYLERALRLSAEKNKPREQQEPSRPGVTI